jgi:hypothetical protein
MYDCLYPCMVVAHSLGKERVFAVFALFVWGSFPIAISSWRSGLSLFDKMTLYCNAQHYS